MKIYYAKINDIPAMHQDTKVLLNLPAERLERMQRMKNAQSQSQCIAAGLLLEYGLREQNMTSVGKTFGTYEGGKPYILEYPELYYNLSHSGIYVAAVLDDRPVGVDIECLRRDRQKLARRFFAEEEKAVLEQNWSDCVFIQMWTRKEAYLKAVGTGLRGAMDSFIVLDEQVQVRRNRDIGGQHEERYYLKSFCVGEAGWCSVCRRDDRIDAELHYVDLMKEFL